jgi:hypothetical protein
MVTNALLDVEEPSVPTAQMTAPVIAIISHITAKIVNGKNSGNFQASTDQRRRILVMACTLYGEQGNCCHGKLFEATLEVTKALMAPWMVDWVFS